MTKDLPASQRDGRLRRAITEALNLAEECHCRLVAVENLGFEEMRATGRERYGSAKWSRKVVCKMAAAQFRDRLAAMASRREVAIAGVPAACSSIWGKEHCQAPRRWSITRSLGTPELRSCSREGRSAIQLGAEHRQVQL